MSGPDLCSVGAGTPAPNTSDPFVALSQIINIGGVSVPAEKIAIKLTNEIYDDKDITSAGISDREMKARSVTEA